MKIKIYVNFYFNINFFFFLSGFSFTSTDNSQDSSGRERTIFYSTLPLPPAHKHSDIYLQRCMWDDYHIFLNAPLVFTRLLLNEIYHLIELPFDWLMMCYHLIGWWYDVSFCFSWLLMKNYKVYQGVLQVWVISCCKIFTRFWPIYLFQTPLK